MSDIKDCPFCTIEIRKIERMIDDVFMITPLGPVVEGHKLFIHRFHTDNAIEDPGITAEVFGAAAEYGKDQNALTPKDFNLIVNNGQYAGQSIFHLHVHYIPREEIDELKLPWTEEQNQ